MSPDPDTTAQPEPVCPYCYTRFADWYRMDWRKAGPGIARSVDCPACSGHYKTMMRTSIRFDSRPPGDYDSD